mmetsp:Transcript_69841/g.217954  ORF Transcript_69841/g.217954 Transcript_69841/m.217954 type:complete len:281 (+) Transcript_69841:258-1100(+)
MPMGHPLHKPIDGACILRAPRKRSLRVDDGTERGQVLHGVVRNGPAGLTRGHDAQGAAQAPDPRLDVLAVLAELKVPVAEADGVSHRGQHERRAHAARWLLEPCFCRMSPRCLRAQGRGQMTSRTWPACRHRRRARLGTWTVPGPRNGPMTSSGIRVLRLRRGLRRGLHQCSLHPAQHFRNLVVLHSLRDIRRAPSGIAMLGIKLQQVQATHASHRVEAFQRLWVDRVVGRLVEHVVARLPLRADEVRVAREKPDELIELRIAGQVQHLQLVRRSPRWRR